MDDTQPMKRHPDVKVGTNRGQMSFGNDNRMYQTIYDAPPQVTDAERNQLRALLAALRAQVETAAPPEKQAAALEHVDELAEATNAEEPDLSTMDYVYKWFLKHVPQAAGAVLSVVVHPIVGKLVEAAGDSLTGEWRRRFGGT
jgi:hypothetical protein